jgi:drug/metabolite transporter (DMT)-like permease
MRSLLYAGIAPALACTVVTQVAFLLKQRGARATSMVRLDRPLHGTKALLSSPWFALGMGASVVAWLLHVAALAVAPLSMVQAVLASGVIILALLGRFGFGWSISRRQWYGIALTASGLSVVVLTLPPPNTHAVAGSGMLLFVIAMLGVGAMFVLAPRVGALAHSRGALLGAGAGTLLGVSDVANKALFHVAAGGPLALISSPWLSVTVLGGLFAFVVSGRAFQERDAVAVMACASTTGNITAMLGGIAVFGDRLSSDALLSGLQVSAFVLIAGAALLTASTHGRATVGAVTV